MNEYQLEKSWKGNGNVGSANSFSSYLVRGEQDIYKKTAIVPYFSEGEQPKVSEKSKRKHAGQGYEAGWGLWN